ncbi:hypothetical protein [Enorma massiliensis]|uniref:P-loop NTPase n=1 Tax=Enorma massiliensis TaxID=1472761 RepID=UPI0002F587D4|nr:hypothetical protein [Enorma massiliensis]
MSQINQIQEELRQIEGGRFQTLANQYLYRRYSLSNIVEFGSQCGTDKTTRGVPDMYSVEENGHYLFAAYTTSKSDIRDKLLDDAKDCLDKSKTGIDPQLIDRIVLCHTYFRLSPLALEEVRAIDPRIEIIGPETIASDLDGKYPALAHTVLGIPLGKGSFIAPDRFIEHNSHARFRTDLSKPLVHRESELAEAIESIEQNKAVVIQGQSGSGKTKIALEACLSFSEKHRWDFLILDSKYSANLDEDIELILSESENIIILADDANGNLSLEHLLGICSEKDKLKIVFTCRKMHRNELTARISACLRHKEIELAPLAAKDIEAILETEYEIKNLALRERVSAIANGNLRLAIMAASSIADGNFEAIQEPYDLLNAYMNCALADYSNREQLLAETLAIYDCCDLTERDPCYEDLLGLGCDDAEIRNLASKLDDQEIVTTLTSSDGTLAIRMEEQNLRDFLICRHFAKEGNGSFADFILRTIEMPNAPYLKAAKSMAEVCGSASVYDYLRRECEKAWDEIKNRDARIADQFITAFNQLLPIQALAFASNRIENAACADLAEEILDANSTSDGSMPLHIAVSLMNSDEHSQTALELFVECIERGTEQAFEYNWACGPNCAFSYDLDRTGFDLENSKLDALVERYQQSHSRNIAACLIVLTSSYLSSMAQHVRQNGLTYALNTLTYNFTSKLAELHAHCFQALSALTETEFGERAKSIFRQHFSFYGEEPETNRAENMRSVLSRIEDLFPAFINGDTTSDLLCCVKISKIYAACAQEAPLELSRFSQSTFDALEWEDIATCLEEGHEVSSGDFSLRRLTEALPKLVEDLENPDRQWQARQAIECVLLQIAKMTPETAPDIIADLIASSPSTLPIPTEALEFLAEAIGRNNLKNELSANINAEDRPDLFDCLDLLAVRSGANDQELDEILSRLDDGRTHLSLKNLENIELEHPGYILAYAARFSERVNDVNEIWRFFGNCGDERRVSALSSCFESNPSPAVDLYFLALEGRPRFDYNLAFLRCLLHLESSMIDRFLEYASSLDCRQRHDLLQRISSFWTDQDERAWNLLKALIDEVLSDPLGRFEIAALFPNRDAGALSSDIFWNRLERLVRERIADVNSLNMISQAISECNDETRVRAISLILTLDKDGISINHLDLRRASMSGSPEKGFIPAKLKEIEVIGSIADQLPAGIAYLKHRNWLSKEESSIESDIENEKRRLFHGRQ